MSRSLRRSATTLAVALAILIATKADATARVTTSRAGASRQTPSTVAGSTTPGPSITVTATQPLPKPLKYASLDLFGDSADARGGSFVASVVVPNSTNAIVQRLTAGLAFDPVASGIEAG